jgi:hypothetical protein
MKKIGLLVVFMILAEALLFFAFRWFQPACEPCLDKENCPMCIDNPQIKILVLGVMLLPLLSMRIVNLLRKRNPKNMPTKLRILSRASVLASIFSLLYGYSCRTVGINFLWETISIGWIFLMLGIIGLLYDRIQIRRSESKKLIFQLLSGGLVLSLLVVYLLNLNTVRKDREALVDAYDNDEIVKGCHWIMDEGVKDTSLIIPLLIHILDGRNDYASLWHYGETPFHARVKALEYITSRHTPTKAKWEEDALVVDYWLGFAVERGFIKAKDEIDVIHPYVQDYASSEEEIASLCNHEKVDWLKKYNWPKPPVRGAWHTKGN